MSDLRYALRLLAKSPGFTAVAVLSLALGIGANAAMYSAIRAVLLDALPVRAPEELVELGWTSGDSRRTGITTMGSSQFQSEGGKRYQSNFSYSLYRAFQHSVHDSTELFAFSFAVTDVNVSLGSGAIAGSSLLVSGNYFSALAVPTILGRPLNEMDDRSDAPLSTVITHRFWMRAFGGDRGLLGKSVLLNGTPFVVVGVTTPAFFGMSKGGFFPPTDVILPLAAHPAIYTRAAPGGRSLYAAENKWWLRIMARVKPDARAHVQAALTGTFRQMLPELPISEPESVDRWDVRWFPAAMGVDVLTRRMRQPLTVLGSVVGIVLLIACVNLGNLTLARGVARQKEMSIRIALGSSRWRLVRGTVVEGLVLAIGGGALGILLALWGGLALLAMLTASAGRTALDVSVDGRLLALTASISVVAAFVFSVAPALRIFRGRLVLAMKQVSGDWNAPRLNTGRLLMAAQVALSVPLLAGATLLLRTMYNLGNVDLGFNPDRLMMFRVDPGLNGYDAERLDRFYSDLVQRLEAVPGVGGATLTDIVLLSGLQNNWTFSVGGSEPKNIKFARVGPAYFDTMGIAIVAGRAISVQDHDGAPPAAVVNESAARVLFGAAGPIGRRVSMGSQPPVEYEIVGVAKDSRYTSPRDPMPPTIYLPYEQTMLGRFGPMNVIVRSRVPAPLLDGAIRAAVADVDPHVPVMDMKTQSEQIAQTLGVERTFLRLLIGFGLFALALASIGVHGLTAYSVARRTHEIGVRVALGARRSDVLWLILRQVAVITTLGLTIGIPVAFAATRVIRANLYGVEPNDPLSLATAAVVIAVVAAVAGFVPAQRATTLDPLAALRSE